MSFHPIGGGYMMSGGYPASGGRYKFPGGSGVPLMGGMGGYPVAFGAAAPPPRILVVQAPASRASRASSSCIPADPDFWRYCLPCATSRGFTVSRQTHSATQSSAASPCSGCRMGYNAGGSMTLYWVPKTQATTPVPHRPAPSGAPGAAVTDCICAYHASQADKDRRCRVQPRQVRHGENIACGVGGCTYTSAGGNTMYVSPGSWHMNKVI